MGILARKNRLALLGFMWTSLLVFLLYDFVFYNEPSDDEYLEELEDLKRMVKESEDLIGKLRAKDLSGENEGEVVSSLDVVENEESAGNEKVGDALSVTLMMCRSLSALFGGSFENLSPG